MSAPRLTARERLDRGTKEEDLVDDILATARRFHWLASHQRPAKTRDSWRTAIQGDKGWPDVVATRDGRLLLLEAKRELSDPSPEQVAWLHELAMVPGAEVYVVRPSDREFVDYLLTKGPWPHDRPIDLREKVAVGG